MSFYTPDGSSSDSRDSSTPQTVEQPSTKLALRKEATNESDDETVDDTLDSSVETRPKRRGKKKVILRKFLTFEEARDVVRAQNFRNRSAFARWVPGKGSKSNIRYRPSNIPVRPDKTYGNLGWMSWEDFLSESHLPETVSEAREEAAPPMTNASLRRKGRNFLSFTEARAVIRMMNRPPPHDIQGWKKVCSSGLRPSNIPSHPDAVYEADWKGWKDFLCGDEDEDETPEAAREDGPVSGATQVSDPKNSRRTSARNSTANLDTPSVPSPPAFAARESGSFSGGAKRTWKSFEEAREYVRSLGLTPQTYKVWRIFGGGRPADIPSNPNVVYKKQGWINLEDFLTYPREQQQPVGALHGEGLIGQPKSGANAAKGLVVTLRTAKGRRKASGGRGRGHKRRGQSGRGHVSRQDSPSDKGMTALSSRQRVTRAATATGDSVMPVKLQSKYQEQDPAAASETYTVAKRPLSSDVSIPSPQKRQRQKQAEGSPAISSPVGLGWGSTVRTRRRVRKEAEELSLAYSMSAASQENQATDGVGEKASAENHMDASAKAAPVRGQGSSATERNLAADAGVQIGHQPRSGRLTSSTSLMPHAATNSACGPQTAWMLNNIIDTPPTSETGTRETGTGGKRVAGSSTVELRPMLPPLQGAALRSTPALQGTNRGGPAEGSANAPHTVPFSPLRPANNGNGGTGTLQPLRSLPHETAAVGSTLDACDVQLQLQMNNGLVDILLRLSESEHMDDVDAARYIMHWHGLHPVQRILTFSTLERLQGTVVKNRVAAKIVKLSVHQQLD